ncbi:hypothetical protein MUK42_36216 [Musa troglodytarum]|uniref:Uncharacterized protein n=1 Tax=Musa troglodytarum TaxID=320322 RepID=A0A9E7FDY7_9LILI|nr:hypothetical protein MUK42_36216 [Musa troglodytarum]
MKHSVLQTPRRAPSPASHGGRPKETPPRSKHRPKIVPKRLSCDFSAVPEDILTEFHDLLESSPEESITVVDPPERSPISLPLLLSSPKPEEHGSQESVEIAVNKAAEEQEQVVDRLRGALLEVRKSADVTGGSKRLLGSLVEMAITDVGDDPRHENGQTDSAVCAKVRIGIVRFLILLAALMNLLAISTVLIGCGGRDLSGLPPPT